MSTANKNELHALLPIMRAQRSRVNNHGHFLVGKMCLLVVTNLYKPAQITAVQPSPALQHAPTDKPKTHPTPCTNSH